MNLLKSEYTKQHIEIEGLASNLSVKGFFIHKQNKIVVVSCSTCALDEELFGEGLFFSYKGGLSKGSIPCGCAETPRWESWQWIVRVKRALHETSVNFVDLAEDYKGCYTKVVTYCENHDCCHNKTSLIDLVKGNSGCKICTREKISESNSKGMSYHLSTGINSGSFTIGTEVVSVTGGELLYKCPICSGDEYVEAACCSGVFSTTVSNILLGKKSCRCSDRYIWKESHRVHQIKDRIFKENLPYTFKGFSNGYTGARSKFSYVCESHGEQEVDCHNFLNTKVGCPSCSDYGYDKNKQANIYCVLWTSGNQHFVKVGITNNATSIRIQQQNTKTKYNPVVSNTYTHKCGKLVEDLEKEIKGSFSSGVVSKEIFPDGFTETFHLRDYKGILSLIKTRMEH